VHQVEWIANVVLVPKKDVKVRMYVDFRDLNKACPKKYFPLPHIEVLVDDTIGSALMSFMDGFLGYNQIEKAPKDMTKTTFTTERGIYCYTVMPFRLKNAGVVDAWAANDRKKPLSGLRSTTHRGDTPVHAGSIGGPSR